MIKFYLNYNYDYYSSLSSLFINMNVIVTIILNYDNDYEHDIIA